jgi:hypothetical protein
MTTLRNLSVILLMFLDKLIFWDSQASLRLMPHPILSLFLALLLNLSTHFTTRTYI